MFSIFRAGRVKYLYYILSLSLVLLFTPILLSAGDVNLPPLNPSARWRINLIFLNLLLAYGAAIGSGRAATPRWFWIVVTFVGVTLCAMPPVFSGDVNEYLIRGRVLGVYHQNPYLHAPSEFPQDIFYPLSVWRNWPDDYGPVWTLIQWIAPSLLGFSYFWAVFSLKLILFGFYLASIFVFYRICLIVSPQEAARYTRYLALNPNYIVHHLVDGHNDIVSICLALVAVWFILKNQPLRGVAAGAMACLSKIFSAAVIMPVLTIASVRLRTGQRPPIRELARAVLIHSALFLVVLAFFYSPFWIGWKTLRIFSVSQNWFYTNSIPYAVYLGFQKIGLVSISQQAVRNFCIAVFLIQLLAALSYLYLKPNFTKRDIFMGISWIYLALYAAYAVPFFGSHLNWGLPFLVLANFPHSTVLLLIYTSAGVFAYWKRLSFLYLIGTACYAAWCVWRRRRAEKPLFFDK